MIKRDIRVLRIDNLANGRLENIVFKNKFIDEPRRRRPDIALVNATTGWHPSLKLTDGLKHTIACFRDRLASVRRPDSGPATS